MVRRTPRPGTPAILFIGLASGALYAALCFAQPGLANDLVPGAGVGAPDRLRAALQFAGHVAATLGLFGLYARVLVLCRRGRLHDRRSSSLALSFAVVFHVALTFARPAFSIDTLSYLAHGYLGTAPGLHPYLHTAAAVAGTPLGPELAAQGWTTSHGVTPYGPLWTWIEIGVARAMDDVTGGVLLLKAIATAAVLGSAALIWAILGHVRPRARLLGTLVFLWNPLIVTEFAGEGHNDAVVILLVLAAILLAVRRHGAASLLALALGVFTKYLPAVFAPAHLAHLWHTTQDRRRFARTVVLASALGLVAAFALYRGLWVGAATFQGVQEIGTARRSASPAGLLYASLTLVLPAAQAARLATGVSSPLFAAFVLAVSWRCRDDRRLVAACAWIAVVYALAVAGLWWPWYSCLPVALLALTPRGVPLRAAVLLALCARLVAPLDVLAGQQVVSFPFAKAGATFVGTTLPLAILAWWGLRRRVSVPASASAARS